MSMSFIPDDLMPDVKTMEAQFQKMSRDVSAMLPKEFAGSVNLMMHPLAASAAFGALGFGVAGHALGLWVGTVTGSMEAAQKMAGLALRADLDDGDEPAYKAPKSPATIVKAAVETFVEDVEDATRAAIEAGGRTVLAIEKDFEEAVEAVAHGLEAGAGETGAEASAAPDDLKAISGIGPKMEEVLNRLGVWTYAQIVAWDDKDIARVEEHLGFKGRVGRDEWQKQARALAEKTS